MAATKPGTPERLIRAAQDELIQTRGLLEMQAVAKRAKVSVGLAYHHFGSKAGLIALVRVVVLGRDVPTLTSQVGRVALLHLRL